MQFKSQIILIIILMISVLFFVMCDLWAGVRKSRTRGECSVSYGFRKTVEKTCKYYNYMLVLLGIDIIQMGLLSVLNSENGSSFWIIPILTALGACFIGFIEVKSIFEKEDKKEKSRMKEAFDTAKKIAEYLKEQEVPATVKKVKKQKSKIKSNE